ncbi:RNA-directed DNA polymerase, eukaryota [Tanacetum coccineum]
MFSRIYALEINTDCTVADKLQFSVTSSLRRSVRGGVESSQLALLQTYIEGTLLSNMEDRWVWDLNGEGVFRVKDVRILLDECFLPKAPTATRWVKYVPIKINVFAWKVFLDRLPTRSNLQHRGVLVSDLLCPLCSSAQEDSSHLFFSCRLATDIVRLVCRWWNLSWTPLGSYADWLNWFNSIRLSSKVKDLLEGVLYITWWSVWMFRNQLLFSSKAPRKDVIFDDIIDLVMQLINEDQQMQGESSRRSRKAINRERDMAEARVAGANNDLTVLNHSPLFVDLLDDIAPVVPYDVNGVTFEKCYYLADGIYPQWAAFVKSFTAARDERNAVFKRRQESARKDVERAFGVLQGRWHIIAQHARAWNVNKLRRIMYTCIILHNMILNNQKFALSDIGDTYICPRDNLARSWIERCEVQRKQAKELRDKQTHAKLQQNLIEHVWQQHLLNE